MKRAFFVLAFGLFTMSAVAQIAANTQDEYRLYEKQAAEKRLAFKQNPNTFNYDVKHHTLAFTVDPTQYYISGTVTTQFVANQNLQTIVFDLSHALTVSAVTQGTQTAAFSQANNELVIQLPQTVAAGTQGEVKITYEGVPPTNNEAFTQSYHNNTPIIWTLSEPFGAKDWWPCKQSLNDKVDSIDVYITAPEAMVAVTNGVEQSQVSNTNGTKTTHFKHNYPIPAYLVAIAVTDYQIYNQSAGTAPNTFPVVNYLYPENYSTSVSQLAVTIPIMNLFERLFGTYPFHTEKYGHAEFSWGGGMEHTTVSFMGGFSRGLIAHELAHHWFGNKVTCGSWNDIWINEGFAEYMAGLVVEELDGSNAFTNWKGNKINSITSSPEGNVYLTNNQALDANRIFSSRLTYNKGSMVVHMLRYVLGDEDFYQGMRNFLNDPAIAYNYAVTTQVQQHLEAVSGKDLTEFFNDWIYGQGYPSYQIDAERLSTTQTKITLNQTTSHASVPFYEMPVTLQFTGNNGATETVVLQHTQNNQQFIVDTGVGMIDLVTFNPFNDIVSKDNTVRLTTAETPQPTEIIVYPNPSKTSFEVAIPEDITVLSMNIYSINGKLVAKNISNPYPSEQLASGTYLLEIQTPEKTYHKKIIKN
ncbi:T9SS type A sorting domain-containing protein [Flavobacterium sp. CBA20B-1]|uniref:M1 family aminopeptidase n=1 Tax=unclassified Flavobacterium TaxID=196869 RepID=UPI0022243305|nr:MULTISPECIES: M1 family aminopeptidase [unclassified Flavobacterium]WCM40986.1 T9SS type A sorting domain-containing protein [Flavobacterium sp. CBA20B-1]